MKIRMTSYFADSIAIKMFFLAYIEINHLRYSLKHEPNKMRVNDDTYYTVLYECTVLCIVNVHFADYTVQYSTVLHAHAQNSHTHKLQYVPTCDRQV